MLNQLHRHARRARDDLGVVVAREEGVGEGNGTGPAHGGLHGPADGAARQAEERGGVAAVVGAGNDEVDGAPVLEEVEEAELGGGGGGAVDEDPFLVFLAVLAFSLAAAGIALVTGAKTGLDMRGPVVLVQGAGAEVGGLDDLGGEMGFGDPGALLMRQDDRDDVASGLQRLYERVDVRR